ncbi:hypothetical protein PHYPSEUDO_014712 [Phytophthora pseudosyringae]|uniref:C3H1-type domain-containing protein n=1 Tax=Phytophthora pseudosyringae TaxID=221518 RepID=A0A8T1W3A8_9STRA|nr:hypothetical protein PHYPSEUDO_014712 [Phytophthora pseudosyringae]
MAAAAGSPAEPQHEPAPVDAASDGEAAATAATPVSADQPSTVPPDTGELLGRVATEISQAFQSSLVQVSHSATQRPSERHRAGPEPARCRRLQPFALLAASGSLPGFRVVSDIGREYGVEPGAGKFAWMEKGGAAVALAGEQLHGKDEGGDDGDDGELRDELRRILRELQASRLQVRELQQVVDELRDEQRLAKQRVALFGSLSTKLKRDLVDERLALIDAKNEITELRRRRSGDDSGSGGGRSPQSPSLQEQSDNPWSSPNKPIPGASSGAGGSSAAGGASAGSNLMAFNFYPSTASRGEGDREGADDEEPPSPSSSTQTLRSTIMGQFLPSSLLDSPQVTPKHARPFAEDEDKVPPPVSELKDDMESLSLTAAPLATSSTVEPGKPDVGDRHDEPNETSQGEGERLSAVGSVSPLQLSMLSELFDGIPVDELESILQRFDGHESAAIDHILHTHPSFNPAIGAGGRAESGSSLASMASPSPSRSSSAGIGKSSLHRSSSLSGPSGPPPGSSSNWKTEICMYYMQGKCNKTRRTCSFAHGESDLVRPSGSAGISSGSSKHGPNYKTRLCQAYENGTCTKSRRDCPMAHGVNDLRDGGANSGGSAGNQPILPSATPRLQSYKTELCYYFLKGNCNYTKEECRFAHGQGDLRTVESNTAHIAAATGGSGFGGDFPTSPVPPPPAVSMEKQLQLQHQYQRQYQQHHQAPAIPQQHHSFQPQPPPAQQQPSFVPQHQLQLQHSSRGSGGQFGFQHQQYDMAQQQQNPYMQPPPGQFRYLKSMEDKRSTSSGRPPVRRDSGSSWSSFDASGLPPSEY